MKKNAVFREKEKQVQLIELCKEALANSRDELYLQMRFLGTALHSFHFLADEQIQPVGTDGENLYFQPDPLVRMLRTDRKLINHAYMHLLMHCLFCHMFLQPKSLVKEIAEVRDPVSGLEDLDEVLCRAEYQKKKAQWDLACDITAEYLLDDLYLPCIHFRKSSLRLRVYQMLKQELKVVTAQGVYLLLTDEKWAASLIQSGSTTDVMSLLKREFYRDDHSLWGTSTQSKQQQLQNHWGEIRRKIQTELETFSKEASDGTEGLKEQVKVANRRRYDYRAFLRKFSIIREEMKVDPDSFDYIFYDYGMRMYKNMPLIESQETKELNRIEDLVIVIDTSMSCKVELVKHFLEETYTILTQQETYASRFHIHLIQCDEKVQSDHLISSQEELSAYLEDFTVAGQGGTDFRPAFSYVNARLKTGDYHRLKGLLYFTDGHGIYPVKKPVYDTVFLFMKDDYSDVDVPPWAMKLILDPLEWREVKLY